MATSKYFNTFIVGALLLGATCISTPTQPTASSRTWDDQSNYVGTPASSFSPVVVKDVKVFTATNYLEVPEAPMLCFDLVTLDYEAVVQSVEPRCNSPTQHRL